MITVAVPSERYGPRVFTHVGDAGALAIWRSHCVVCQTPFEVTTPIGATEGPAFEMSACGRHLGTTLQWRLASVVICKKCDGHHIEGMKHVCDPDAVKAKQAKTKK